jgi:hypothetical protein
MRRAKTNSVKTKSTEPKPPREPVDNDRYRRMIELAMSGGTLRSIGREFGISYERVR